MEFDEDISEDDCIVNANIAKSMAIDLSDIMLDANNAVAVDKSLCRVSEIKRRTVQEEIKCRKKSCADILQESKTEDYIEVKPFTHLKGKKNKDVPNDDILISKNFSRFNISKPILKAITAMHHINPTPIQLSTIPVALEGRDICGCAITGSGKTLAFLIPIVERLLFRPRNKQTRVLILSPTRELAMQTCQVMQQLCQFFPHPINICKAIGGFDLKSQENALKLSPDVVIATPGRLIDHLHNSPSFSLHTVEILVLDEADRMLDEYFSDQMHEVIRLCSKNRQTMLFSATLSEEVKDLSAISLRNPVNICVDKREQVAPGISQEFIRIRANQEKDREPILLALLIRVCPKNTIIFARTKIQCHRIFILLGLLDLKSEELHGSVPQAKRVLTMQQFKNKEIDILVATDLAARGLDIPDVETVINFTMPNTFKQYIHRVGRTARAGTNGRSISLCSDDERKILKEIIKSPMEKRIMRRIIPSAIVQKMKQKINTVETDILEILEFEKSDKLIEIAEKQLKQSENTDKEQNESRSWFQTPTEQKASAKRNKLLARQSNSKAAGTKRKSRECDDGCNKDEQISVKFHARMYKKGIKFNKRQRNRLN